MKTETLVIIPCGQSKVWDREPQHGPIEAGDAYTGTPFVLNRQYAARFGTKTVILSAKYGFIPLNFEIPGPYNVTFKRRKTNPVSLEVLKTQIADQELQRYSRIVAIGGKEYRAMIEAAFDPFSKHVEFPFAGLPIGKGMQAIKRAIDNQSRSPEKHDSSNICERLHLLLNRLPRFKFPFDPTQIPRNGIYILFEAGETGHGGERIVRIGTHTGQNQLRSRLRQHFGQQKKDRSIFRKNIGRTLLVRENDPFLSDWELDLTSRAAREKHIQRIDMQHQLEIERQVTDYMLENFEFVVFPVEQASERLHIEALLISTVCQCSTCGPSPDWLGQCSPVAKIKNSGLWQVNELDSLPFDETTFSEFHENYLKPHKEN